MKLKIILVLQIFNFLTTMAQLPDWHWARSASGTGQDEGMGISTDPWGNTYITGYFSSPTITFDTITLINAGFPNHDIFIVK